jgi:hypothetical protein
MVYEKLKSLIIDKCPFVNLPETGVNDPPSEPFSGVDSITLGITMRLMLLIFQATRPSLEWRVMLKEGTPMASISVALFDCPHYIDELRSLIEVWEEPTTHRVNVANMLHWLKEPGRLPRDNSRKEKLRAIIKS